MAAACLTVLNDSALVEAFNETIVGSHCGRKRLPMEDW